MGSAIWFATLFVGLGLVSVLPRLAWYALMSHKQRVRYEKDVQLAASRGMPPPQPPPPPDFWGVQRRVTRFVALIGIAGALIAGLVLVLSSRR